MNQVLEIRPDIIVAYGCSIIREPLLRAFPNRILNIHLGLSPYYRGSGTNVWAMINREPECVGTTFMYMDSGIDTGKIIHQIRARVFSGDTPHSIGNRLIADSVSCAATLVNRFESLLPVQQLSTPHESKVYKVRDFTVDACRTLYDNFASGMVNEYLTNFDAITQNRPIITNAGVN